ncbi:uncharacterized protein LOC130648488 [Hydractinia symbiolongicarpus]|uniref:uncharacterized protein LOC130648488 n=1 Tax=Hydractinia symbiolongicarpus TaxID=13093 RepID=UPI00254C6674|nr:uncharacterized protein LOC130648488 [Hydractinia symbiolongicarpus]
MENDCVDIKIWERKRRTTVLAYMFLYFLRGIEQSANTATLWIYLTKLIKTEHADVYYGLINIAIYILPMLFSSVVARYADKTRRIKLTIIITNFVSMLGSITYILPWSPLCPFIGKLLNGAVIISKPLMIGEMARSFSPCKLQSKITYLVFSKAVGYVMGPCVVLPFTNLNVWFGQIQIAYGNISGLVLLILTIVAQLWVIFFAHDLSREYDMKKATATDETVKHKDLKSSAVKALKGALTSKIIVFMLFISFYGCILNIAFFRGLPVLVLDILGMSYQTVSHVFVLNGICNIVLYIFSIKIKMGNVTVYSLEIASLVSIIIVSFIQFTLVYCGPTINVKVSMLLLYVVSLSVFEIGQEIFLVVIFAKLISSKYQSYLESIREILELIGCILGAFLSLTFMKYASIFMPLFIFINLLSLIFLFLFRNNLIHPDILV